MKERPILFTGKMVCSILARRKTQTRRTVKFPIKDRNGTGCEIAGTEINSMLRQEAEQGAGSFLCPYGGKGDRLWVREAHRLVDGCECKEACHVPGHVYYEADQSGYDAASTNKLRPSIFMPRWASRITLELASVRVERLWDISIEDAIAEGVGESWSDDPFAIDRYQSLWESINGEGSWRKNPWVWVLSFKII